MDANSNNVCKEKDIAHGAGSRRKFNHFVEQIELKSCFPSLEIESKPAPKDDECKYHTVRKERTYLQMQLKKAEKLDQSLKDWVVTHFDVTKTVRVNKFVGAATWSEKSGIWADANCMPNSMCPSDHCMLISHLVLKNKKNGTGCDSLPPAEPMQLSSAELHGESNGTTRNDADSLGTPCQRYCAIA